ncbi:hypothetical protein A8C32_19235 [Flavivirga aquatica]|uniref:Cyclic nucleotide-binding protein n=1 Tax=Flavivirga aquatica TaxID=1849968 RepID=A0A1E5T458_9FLAO|nr:Crp/Fnr family transcriptional regulator [Flavivirga aquatica]OEK06164.1 hypothetical protein A8C32_19235 [Flavivirga aquatica]
MNSLIDLFNSILPISDNERLLMEERMKIETYNKGQKHNTNGEICKKLSYIKKGIFKVEGYNSNEEEFIKYFAIENNFAVDLDSFINKEPSKENITAITACEVVTITSTAFEFFEKNISNFSQIINTLKAKALLEKYTVKSEMFVDDAYTRYNKFMQRYPTIIQRVSQKHIASHLGISQYTLSRIRAK